jgi:LPXTG-site transpeptidase (sortase) family protein
MHSKPSLFDALWEQKASFLFVFFVIFTLSYAVLFAIDFLPEAPAASETAAESEDVIPTTEAEVKDEEPELAPVVAAPSTPVHLSIPSLDQTVAVLNPTDSSIAALDAALLKGVVRHPDSALLGAEGNTLIMGHSSYLPTVMNHNYQAFNNIQKLNWGDTIVVSSADRAYTYRVEKVYEAKAAAVSIPTEVKGKRLTLITCNSFGTKEDRFIVEAVLISEQPITKTATR